MKLNVSRNPNVKKFCFIDEKTISFGLLVGTKTYDGETIVCLEKLNGDFANVPMSSIVGEVK